MSMNVVSSFFLRAAVVALCALSLTVVMRAQTPLTTITRVDQSPSSIAINPTTGRAYVVTSSGIQDLWVIEDQSLVAVFDDFGEGQLRPAVDTVRNLIYVANWNGVSVINGADNSLTTINNALGAEAVHVDEVRDRVFVVYPSHVDIYSGGSTTPFTLWMGNGSGRHLAVNPDTGNAYFSNGTEDTVTIISPDNTTTTVPVGDGPITLAVNAVTNRVYVLNYNSRDMTVIDGSTLATTMVPLLINNGESNPGQILVVNPESNRIYVANFTPNVTVINGDSLATTVVPVGGRPMALAVNPRTNYVYAVTTSNLLASINGRTNTASFVEVGREPVDVAVNPVTNLIYTANRLGNSVTILQGLTDNNPTIFWPTPAAIPAGTPLSSTQLNAQAFLNDAVVPGTFVYNQPVGTILSPGTHTLSVTFTPDDPGFLGSSATTTIEVLAATIDFTLQPSDTLKVFAIPPSTGLATLRVFSAGPIPFDRRITFQCIPLPGVDVPAFVSCDSPVADFTGNTATNAIREVTVHIFTDGRGSAIARSMPRTHRIGGFALALMLPVAGMLLAVSPFGRRKRRSAWLLGLGLMFIILAPGCASKLGQPDTFRMRIQAIPDNGGPSHTVAVDVVLNDTDGGN